MWKVTITANALLLFLFWIAGELAIAPAYNHFIQYPGAGGVIVLPLVTQIALSVRTGTVALPIGWTLVSFFIYRLTRHKTTAERNEYLLAFTLITVSVGLSVLIIFGLAGILPYLLIGATVK